MTSPLDLRHPLEAAIAELQSRRAVLGNELVDAALAPLLERWATLGAQPESPAQPTNTEPSRRLRQVSVLFLDIVGSTQLIQHLDPEEVQAVVDGALAAFTAIVTHHGGEVLRYAGDNIKAAFGAHDTVGTREDDAERAVNCGLAQLAEAARRGDEVKRLHGHEGFNARVGIHTGGVVRGGGVENDNSMSGLAVNIAARLEQAAAAGTLRISQDTWALVRGFFDAQVQPPLAVKGVEAPITSWLVHGPKPRAFRLHARGIQGQETPLIGRQAELARFEATLEALLADRAPRALTLIADAGLGKSRLLHEFQHILSAHPSTWWLMPSRNQPSGALQPYGLLRDLLARRLEIADNDRADVARAKLVEGLAPWLGQVNDPAPELLGHLIGLDFSASAAVQRLGGDTRLLRDLAVTALRLWLERLAASDGSPVVLLLDDLHWADDASLDALVMLLKAASTSKSCPLLALLCARPGLIERVPNWGEGLPQHERLTLQPLDAAQGSALTHSLLRRLDPVPTELAELIERRAEGNPFYAEELVAMLLDQGAIGSDSDSDGEWRFHAERLNPHRLPTTLTGVLQARLDALDPEARRALQMASVIGPVFWDDALGALDARGPEALPALQRKSLVQLRPTSAFDDTPEEAFQHHLLHQVSYDTVLKPQKREAHARAAAWLTQRVGDRSDEYLALTAEHYESAGQAGLSADWFERASIKANERHASQAALQYLDRAEAQAVLMPEPWPLQRVARALRRRALLCDGLALREPQGRALDRLLALGEAHGNLRWIGQALTNQSILAYHLGHQEQADALARRGADAAERDDDLIHAVGCRCNLGVLALGRGELDTAREHLELAMRWSLLARERWPTAEAAHCEVRVLLSYCGLNEKAGVREANGPNLARALVILREHPWPMMECACLQELASHERARADFTESYLHLDGAARLAEEFGLPLMTAVVRIERALSLLFDGQSDAAVTEALTAAENFRALGGAFNELLARDCAAEASFRGGRRNEAIAIWQAVAPAMERHGQMPHARSARLRLADAMAASGQPADLDAALLAVRDELPALQKLGALGGNYKLWASRAAWRVLQRAGDPAAAGMLVQLAAGLEQLLSSFSDPEVRERVRNTVPWHRDVFEALAQSNAAA